MTENSQDTGKHKNIYSLIKYNQRHEQAGLMQENEKSVKYIEVTQTLPQLEKHTRTVHGGVLSHLSDWQ